jgi:hypothetical protein
LKINTCKECRTPESIRPPALAEMWGTTTGVLGNMRHLGKGPAYWKLGESVLYRMTDVLAYEAANSVEPVEVAA